MSSQVNGDMGLERTSESSRTIPEDLQIQVRFRSRLSHYAITDSIIAIPAGLYRFGLSGIINHLLATTKPIPFDFLIDGQFLRTNVAQFMQAHSISPVSRSHFLSLVPMAMYRYALVFFSRSHVQGHIIGIGHRYRIYSTRITSW
jgi:hypothetical protein